LIVAFRINIDAIPAHLVEARRDRFSAIFRAYLNRDIVIIVRADAKPAEDITTASNEDTSFLALFSIFSSKIVILLHRGN